jgi:acyl-CoA dehydrogenase
MSVLRPADPAAIPEPAFDNLFRADPLGESLFGAWMGSAWGELRPVFDQMGAAGAAAQPLSARADRLGPVLHTHDGLGRRVDRIEYHPDYHALEELAYGAGIVSRKFDPAFLAKHRSRRHLTGFGAGYYFAQTELGLYCPICMTDGVGIVLERHAPHLAERVVPRLGHPERARRLRGAMFLTEKQGGSDVGANSTVAQPFGSRWILNGDKWFCSNVDAEAILALARMPEGGSGTRGLGLFLVLREDPPGNGASIRIHRLKEKLGVRSMPSGEVTLENTEAYLVAGANEGFKRMAEMINLSRLYNAVASVAGLRRALLEALAYGAERSAFGERLWRLPLWRAGMSDLMAEHLGGMVLTFAAVRALDAAEGGDLAAAKETRVLIPMAKALTGKLGVFGVSEAMEAIGGNAYIEDSLLPRLLRDVQVLPIWEGTTNILTLDVLRAIQRERCHEAFFDRIARALASGDRASEAPLRDEVASRARRDAEQLRALESAGPEEQQRGMRGWLEAAGRTATLALLLEAAHQTQAREACLAAFRRLAARPFGTAPLVATTGWPLHETEEPLLRAGFAPRA